MAVLYRMLLDFVVEEELSDHRLQSLADETSHTLHVSILEQDDEVNLKVEKLAEVHLHDSTENRCRPCEMRAYDDRNGDSVVAELEDMQV